MLGCVFLRPIKLWLWQTEGERIRWGKNVTAERTQRWQKSAQSPSFQKATYHLTSNWFSGVKALPRVSSWRGEGSGRGASVICTSFWSALTIFFSFKNWSPPCPPLPNPTRKTVAHVHVRARTHTHSWSTPTTPSSSSVGWRRSAESNSSGQTPTSVSHWAPVPPHHPWHLASLRLLTPTAPHPPPPA